MSAKSGHIIPRVAAAVVAVAVIIGAVWSCNTAGCTDNQNSLPLAGFYSSASGSGITVSNLDISGVGAPGDSVLYGSSQSRSEVYLPFRSDAESTSYVFTYHPNDSVSVSDQISFSYTSQPYFASEDCGALFHYRITSMSHTSNFIDSVVITDSLITNVNQQRIKIYFRTEEQQEPEE